MSARFRVGVIGAGAAGRRLAGAFARAGATVAVYDPEPDRLSVVPYRIALELDAIGADPAAADRVVPVATLAAAACAELVLEAAPEELALKRMLCAQLGLRAPAAAVVATVTSTLGVAEIAVASPRPDRFLGIDLSPPPAEAAVLIPAEMTDPAAVDRVAGLLAQSLGWMTNASPARQSGVRTTSAKRQPSAVRTQRQS
jgi:3-hydroxyacyl-CoA dehydrogenase